jgi:hypothetical protein
MQDKTIKRKRVKISVGKRPKPVKIKFLLFGLVATAILLVFYLFSLADFGTPQN